MLYLSKQTALTLPCKKGTHPLLFDIHSEKIKYDICNIHHSVFGIYGLESLSYKNLVVNNFPFVEYKSDHHRACLDIFESSDFSFLEGKIKTIFWKEGQLKELFTYITRLKDGASWKNIDCFLKNEAPEEWKQFNQTKKIISFKQ